MTTQISVKLKLKKGAPFRAPIIPEEKQKEQEDFYKKLKKLAQNNQLTRKIVRSVSKCQFVTTKLDEKGNVLTKTCKRKAIGSGQLCKKHKGQENRTDFITEETCKLLGECADHVGVKNIETSVLTKAKTEAKTEDSSSLTSVKLIPLNSLLKYKGNYHPKKMLELSKAGYSEVEIAAEFHVPVRTLHEWAENFEIFAEAYDVSSAIYESWWLRKGKEGLDDVRNFNTSLFKFLTSNKLGYSEKTENRNVNISAGVLVVPPKTSISEWERDSRDPQDIIDL